IRVAASVLPWSISRRAWSKRVRTLSPVEGGGVGATVGASVTGGGLWVGTSVAGTASVAKTFLTPLTLEARLEAMSFAVAFEAWPLRVTIPLVTLTSIRESCSGAEKKRTLWTSDRILSSGFVRSEPEAGASVAATVFEAAGRVASRAGL